MKLLNCIIVALASTHVASANPVASPLDKKVSENCAVTIHGESAQVKCAIDYKLVDLDFEVVLPVFVPRGTPEKKVAQMIQACLQINGGKIIKADRYDFDLEITESTFTPKGFHRVDCKFSGVKAPATRISTVFTYNQPIHKGQFVYLPQFEDGEVKRDEKAFVFTASATDKKLLEMSGTDAGKTSPKVTLTPQHEKLITLTVK